jgi:hypothetical protein
MTTKQTWTADESLADLCDSATNETIGQASTEQIEASRAAGPEGHILIDADTGEVVPDYRPGSTLRKVYVILEE